ncbi:hypothetical protein ACFLZJ_00395 [Nanoarchaeota archaeon]
MEEYTTEQESRYKISRGRKNVRSISVLVEYAGLVTGILGAVDKDIPITTLGAAMIFFGNRMKKEVDNYIEIVRFSQLENQFRKDEIIE